jgi:hypothetical protein
MCVCVSSTKHYSVIQIGAKVRVLTGGFPVPPQAEQDHVASAASPAAAPSVEELAARLRAEAEVCVCVCVCVCV